MTPLRDLGSYKICNMRNLLIVTAAFIGISGAAFAQGANNGAGGTGPEEAAHTNTALNTNSLGNAPGQFNGTIASNGTGTTATGGIDKGVDTTLSRTERGGEIGNEGGSSQ